MTSNDDSSAGQATTGGGVTEETIGQFVRMVEAAEVLARTIGCPTARAAEIIMRSIQAFQAVSGASDPLAALRAVAPPKVVQ